MFEQQVANHVVIVALHPSRCDWHGCLNAIPFRPS